MGDNTEDHNRVRGLADETTEKLNLKHTSGYHNSDQHDGQSARLQTELGDNARIPPQENATSPQDGTQSTSPQTAPRQQSSAEGEDKKDQTKDKPNQLKKPRQSKVYKSLCDVVFHYLYRAESGRVFLHKTLPTNIACLTGNEEEKGERSFGEYGQSFKATLDLAATKSIHVLETLLFQAWFLYQKDSEQMAWMEIRPVERRAYTLSESASSVTSINNTTVSGGAMAGPTEFVKHWTITGSVQVTFEHDKELLSISQDLYGPEEVMEITYKNIDDTIIAHHDTDMWHVFIGLKHPPKLLQKTAKRKSVLKDEKRLVCLRSVTGERLGYTSAIRLEIPDIKTPQSLTSSADDRVDIWMVIARLKRHGFSISYANVTERPPEHDNATFDLKFRTFELEYAWRCLLSCGYKVMDTITPQSIQMIEDNMSVITPDVFHFVVNKTDSNQIFEFEKSLIDGIEKFRQSLSASEKDEIPSHFTMIRRMVVTPTHDIFLQKEPIVKNRIIRQYDDEYFIRVIFRDEDFTRLSAAMSEGLLNVTERIRTFMDKGFTIGDRKYEFLACSNSQMREHGVWFFSPNNGITADDIRSEAGSLSQETSVSTYVSRLGLCFSASRATVEVDVAEGSVTFIDDIEHGGYCFTDGVGKISVPLAKQVAETLQLDPVPSAFQIRYGGCKGVVSQDPTLGDSLQIHVRGSMKKFESLSKNLEILQTTHPGQLYLNRQVVTLMSGLGVPDNVFLGLQERMLLNMADMLIDDERARRALSEVSIGIKYKDLKRAGVSFTNEAFFRSVLMTIYKSKLVELTRRARIEIAYDKGRILMGTVDETGTLQYEQVFVSYSKYSGMKHVDANILQGDVVVAKNPCFHPGDLRKFQAVDVPALHHLVDCIVFPQKGSRPHPDEMSGSDLDGDMYFVCWDTTLHPPGPNRDPMEFPKAPKARMDTPVEISDVTRFLSEYIRNDQLGVIANAHVVHADGKDIFCAECITLARKHSDAVDFPKTGVVAEMTTDLRAEQYPDFMMKSDKPRYLSGKVLGKLYRQCRSLEQAQNRTYDTDLLQFSFVLDTDMLYPGYGKFMSSAYLSFDLYNDKVWQLMSLYGIDTEAEIVTGIIQKLHKKRGYLQNEKFEIGKIIQAKMSVIRHKLRSEFFEEFDGEEHCLSDDLMRKEVLAKASAWYAAAYDIKNQKYITGRRMVSFPWILSDLLSQVKAKRGTTNAIENSNSTFTATDRPVLSQIGSTIVRHFDSTYEDRVETYEFLSAVSREVYQHIISEMCTAVKITVTGVQALCLMDTYSREVDICLELPQRMHDRDFTRMISQIMRRHKRLSPHSFIFETGHASISVTFTQSTLDKDRTKFLQDQLQERPCYMLIVTFLLDWARKYRLIGRAQSAVFGDLVFLILIIKILADSDDATDKNKLIAQAEVRSWLPVNLTSNDHVKTAELLLGTLRSFTSLLKTNAKGEVHITTADPSNPRSGRLLVSKAIKWRACKHLMEEILFAYQEIAKNRSVTVFFDQTVLEEDHMIYNLPLDIWGSVMFAESYTARRLSAETGAEVSIRRTTFKDIPGLILEAWGNHEQLWNVRQSLQDLDDKSSKFLTTAARDKAFIHGAYKCIFHGSTNLDQTLRFTRYRGRCQPHHKEHTLYVASVDIPGQTESIAIEIFKDIFRKQMELIRQDFDKTYHGDLRIALTFGIYYLCHLCHHDFTISELENEMYGKVTPSENRRELHLPGRRRGGGRRGRSRRNYTSLMPRQKHTRGSFIPVECAKQNVQAFLDSGFFKENTDEVKYHATFKLGNENYGKRHEGLVVLDKDMKFIELRLGDLKWMAADVCRGYRDANCSEKRIDVRCKLQSRRMVDMQGVKDMADTKMLLEPDTRVLVKHGDHTVEVHPKFRDRVPFVREKHVKSYKYTGPSEEDSIWHNMNIEISTVFEYSENVCGRFQSVVKKQEVTVIPVLPPIQTEDDEWLDYADKIWELIEQLGEQFDDV